jgi:hypothetical protein
MEIVLGVLLPYPEAKHFCLLFVVELLSLARALLIFGR